MEKLSKIIVKYRNLILLAATLLLIPCVFGYLNTRVNYDILSYLPKQSESMQAQAVLNDDFNLASTAMVVMDDATDQQVQALKDQIAKIDGVDKTLWRTDVADLSIPAQALPDELKDALYSKGATMIIVTFKEPVGSDTTMNAIEKIKEISNDNTHIAGFSAITADTKSMVLSETPVYTAVAVALCLVVLSLGLKSWLAPFIFLAGMIYPILYNMGTNIFFGEISYITNALSMILLLAVSMDYSIFLLHRYQEEKAHSDTKEEAMAKAIHATFTSITSSSITTVAGFLALVFMQLTLGRDIGLVMAKGVVLAVMSTILILPSLLMFFDPWIEKYQHKVLIRPFPKAAHWIVNHKAVFLAVFAILFVPAVYMQAHAGQYYDLTASLPSDLNSVIGTNELKDKFNMTTSHFVLVDDSLTPAQMNEIIDGLENIDGVSNVIAYEKFVGPAIPVAMEPEALDEVLHQDGKRLILVNSTYRSATDQINNQLQQMTDLLHKYDKNALIAGEGAMTKDLITVTNTDFKMVNIVSIAAILLIIALTFKSFSLPLILVLAIEFAIELNMGIPYLTHTEIPFIAGIVIGTIQLGACIDYAILMTSRFKEELQLGKAPKEAVTTALTMTSSSIITSGLSFFAACSGVSLIARMDMIKSLCILLGRGALISVCVILTILPGLLLVCSKWIAKSTKDWPAYVPAKTEKETKNVKGMKGAVHHA
ncbi:MAG: MMPL family transporter [Ileibacterium sp.]|nr:MMPL family transporter [Ileibacterium sp.]